MNKLIEKIGKRIGEISEPIRPVGWSKKIEVVETKAVLDIIHEESKAYNESVKNIFEVFIRKVECNVKTIQDITESPTVYEFANNILVDLNMFLESYKEVSISHTELVKTNVDYIRNMTDEELASFLVDVETHGYHDCSVSGSLEMLDWLQSEAE